MEITSLQEILALQKQLMFWSLRNGFENIAEFVIKFENIATFTKWHENIGRVAPTTERALHSPVDPSMDLWHHNLSKN